MNSQINRLENMGSINRKKTINFTFDGVSYVGYEGDSLASALLANGVKLLGRSFKYHRPRGLLTAHSHEPNALVELRSGSFKEPNIPATMVELFEGLSANSQNRWPSLKHDLLSVNSLFSKFLVAGFYYKTFKWPAKFWTGLYEPIIRKAAGLGSLSGENDPDSYEKSFKHCDILIVGAGPSGLSAAISAAKQSVDVILVDEHSEIGGSLRGESMDLALLEKLRQEVLSLSNIKVMTRSTVFGWYDSNSFGVIERVSDHLPKTPTYMPRQKMWKVVAKQVILSTGAHERPLVFQNNDRPGVMLASAVCRYLNLYGVTPGKQAIVFGNNDSGKETVKTLVSAGVKVAAYVDTRKNIHNLNSSVPLDIPTFTHSEIIDVIGGSAVKSVVIQSLSNGDKTQIECDLVCVAGGWNPAVQLQAQRGINPKWDQNHQAYLPKFNEGPGYICCGSVTGLSSTKDCLSHGEAVGFKSVEALNNSTGMFLQNEAPSERPEPPHPLEPYFMSSSNDGKAFIDFQHDVTRKDVELAAREGYQSVEHVKRYTTLGMATDQGKSANVNGIAILSNAIGKPMGSVGTTGFRPPYTPVSLGVLAGPQAGNSWFLPTKSPLHDWMEQQGGKFIHSGRGLRSQYFPKNNEDMQSSINREVLSVRQNVAFCDVSSLGKIDLQGKDSVTFLNRVYSNGFAKLPINKSRYGLMLREDGIVFDDGTVTRFGENHFFLTTTSAEAHTVISHLEYCHQVLWPELDIVLTDCAEQYAAVSLAGPNARRVLAALVKDDVSDESLPYLNTIESSLVDHEIPCRIFRISFSGELAYEIFVGAGYAETLGKSLLDEGEEYDICQYGVEALDVLRIEKGHVSSEITGNTSAKDLNLGAMASDKKDYVGSVLKNRDAFLDKNREAVVGVLPFNSEQKISNGAHAIPINKSLTADNDLGYLTSATWSPTLNSYIAIGLIQGGSSRIGDTVQIVDPLNGRTPVKAKLVSPHFYDPENQRVKM